MKSDICVAVCKTAGRWAIGLDPRQNCREQAAKLALAVALAPLTGQLPNLISAYPDFATCVQEALEPGSTHVSSGSAAPAATVGGAMAASVNMAMIPPSAAQRPLERDTAHRISFDQSGILPPILEKVYPEGIAVVTEGKKRPKLYGKVEGVLRTLLMDPDKEVEYHDDPAWEMFPQIGLSLRNITDEEIGMTLAVCPYYGAWGIGLGPSFQNRQVAAKVALASVLYLKACDVGAPPELPDQAAFETFVYDLLTPVMQQAVDQAWKTGVPTSEVLAGFNGGMMTQAANGGMVPQVANASLTGGMMPQLANAGPPVPLEPDPESLRQILGLQNGTTPVAQSSAASPATDLLQQALLLS